MFQKNIYIKREKYLGTHIVRVNWSMIFIHPDSQITRETHPHFFSVNICIAGTFPSENRPRFTKSKNYLTYTR